MKRVYGFLICILYATVSQAQKLSEAKEAKDFLQASENRRSANSKDLLSNIMRVSLQNLLGDDKSFELNTTLYALDSIVNPSSRGITDDEYRKQRTQRNIQLNAAISADDNNEISKISGGFTYALSNKKDITYADYSAEIVPLLTRFRNIRREVKMKIEADLYREAGKEAKDSLLLLIAETPKLRNKDSVKMQIAAYFDSIAQVKADEILETWQMADEAGDYTLLSPLIQDELSDLPLADREFLLEDGVHKKFLQLAELYARKGLLTVSGLYTYHRLDDQPEYLFALNYTVGLNKSDLRRKPLELEAYARLQIGKDTLQKQANTDFQLFSAAVGLNKILIEDASGKSAMEFKGFIGYQSQIGSVQAGTDTELFTLNATLRFRVLQSLWIPLTLSYDPEHANFLGQFSITANLGDLTGR